MKRTSTCKFFEKSLEVIPGGVNSPVRAFKNLDILPIVMDYGKEDIIVDVDENSYVDFCMSWGALILGHAPEEIVKKVQDRVSKGSTFGLTCKEEIEIASWIKENISSIKKIRFVSSGTEAVMTAIRLARAYTKHKYIIKFDGNYHGHVDHLLVKAGSYLHQEAATEGVLKENIDFTISLPYNDLNFVKKFLSEFTGDIAAIIIEPVAANMGVVPSSRDFLVYLQEIAKSKNAVLIFDEVISFFRVGLKGASGFYNIQPDLICFGKIIGGGYPAAAVGGKAEIMDQLAPLGNVYQAGTLSGNPVAMTAGFATLQIISKPDFYENLFKTTQDFLNPLINYILEKKLPVCINQLGAMFTIFFGTDSVKNSHDLKNLDENLFKRFFTHMFNSGIYIPPSQQEAWFISSKHSQKNLEKTKNAILEFFKIL